MMQFIPKNCLSHYFSHISEFGKIIYLKGNTTFLHLKSKFTFDNNQPFNILTIFSDWHLAVVPLLH